MTTTWVRKPGRSWHLLRLTRSLTPKTRCGWDAGPSAEFSDDLPGGRSCESCLKYDARDRERADG